MTRLPDFSRDEPVWRGQIERAVAGWSSPSNTSRVALALRCMATRLPVGRAMSAVCPEVD